MKDRNKGRQNSYRKVSYKKKTKKPLEDRPQAEGRDPGTPTDPSGGIPVTIETRSPLILGGGKADVNLDLDVVCDSVGLPYFPGRRFKGLLFESLLEVVEMSEQSGLLLCTRGELDRLFHHGRDDGPQMVISDFCLYRYEEMKKSWAWLEQAYGDRFTKEDVLQEYSSVRFSTSIDKETGTALDGSLHNVRALDGGLRFYGTIRLEGGRDRENELLALGLANLRSAGMKRNRGFGEISCEMEGQEKWLDKALARGGKA